jgi:hypothetical protein
MRRRDQRRGGIAGPGGGQRQQGQKIGKGRRTFAAQFGEEHGLREQHQNAEPGGGEEGLAPSGHLAHHGSKRHARDCPHGDPSQDQRHRTVPLRLDQPAPDRCGEGPESPSARPSITPQQNRAKVGGERHGQIGQDDEAGQHQQQPPPVQPPDAEGQRRSSQRRDHAGDGDHQSGVPGRDTRSFAMAPNRPIGRNSLVTMTKVPMAIAITASQPRSGSVWGRDSPW